MNTTLFKQYQALDETLKTLEAEKEELRRQIVAEMHQADIGKSETDYGIFTIAKRLTYIYTDKVQKIAERLKLAKIREEEKGLAKSKVTEYLSFTKNGQV